MAVNKLLADIMSIGITAGLISIAIYYWMLLPSNRRLGVAVLALWCTALLLEYGRVALAYVLGHIDWGYGSWPMVATRTGVFLIVLLANYSVYIKRRRS